MQRSPAEPLRTPSDGPAAAGTVAVLLFGALREAAGWKRREVPLAVPAGSPPTPALLWRQLDLTGRGALCSGEVEAPQGEAATGSGTPIRVAVNHCFATPETVLRAGDEVAFLPPISGG